MGRLMVVVGGQFGSEAKGACAAALAARSSEPLVIRTGGPNAGHTVWRDGTEYKLRQLPTAAVSNPNARLAIAAGSVVDPELVHKEIADTGTERFIQIDETATVLEPRHIDEEVYASKQLTNWSTQKGIGAARADRIMRKAKIWRDVHHLCPQTTCTDVAHLALVQLQGGGDVIIEAAQGYGLGLHTTYYPKTTSADCRAIDALAAVGISPWIVSKWARIEIWVVMRPYPIRVAGESGPLRNETSWAELGLPEEHTTVTNKVRRVGTWDQALAEAAIRANGGPSPEVRVWFSMIDQVLPELAGATAIEHLWEASAQVRDEVRNWATLVKAAGAPIHALGTGPATHIMTEGKNY